MAPSRDPVLLAGNQTSLRCLESGAPRHQSREEKARRRPVWHESGSREGQYSVGTVLWALTGKDLEKADSHLP